MSLRHPEGAQGEGWGADAGISLLLFLAAWGVYAYSPIVTAFDSRFSMQVAASLWEGRGGELTPWRGAIDSVATPSQPVPSQVRILEGRVISFYPIGAPLLASPLLGLVGRVDPARVARLKLALDHELEQSIAAFLAALSVPLVYGAARRRGLGRGSCALAAAVFALGTSQWSTSSRALWQHGPLILVYAVALLACSGPQVRWGEDLLAGVALGGAVLIRQTAVLALGAMVGGALLARAPGRAGRLLVGASGPVALLMAYNLWAYGQLGNPYTTQYLEGFRPSAEALVGLLASPSRGLLVFSPVLGFALHGLVLAGREGSRPWLDRVVATYLVAHWLALAAWPRWDGGHSYGPRMMSDVLPFLVPYLARSWEHLRDRPGRGGRLAFLVLFGISAAIHFRGAWHWSVWKWNLPDPAPFLERLWSWRKPQFLATSRPRGPDPAEPGPGSKGRG